MGCSDSKVIETSDMSVNGTAEPTKKASPSKKVDQSLSVRQWFDKALALPPAAGEKYEQSPLPDHYIQQQISFDNDNVDNSIWDRKVEVKPQPDQSKSNNKKKGSNENEMSWHYRKVGVKSYNEAEDTLTLDFEFEAGSMKKQVVVLGGLYLGSSSAPSGDILSQVDPETTHTLVLLGNVFDTLCADPLHQAPTDITKIQEQLTSQSEAFCSSLKKLAQEVKVYYMTGPTDCELTRVAIERLLGENVTLVQQNNLVLSLKISNDPYRLLLTTGRQWDFLNYSDIAADQLLVGKPIGYYLARASAQNPQFSISNLMKPIGSSIPDQLSKDFLQQVSKRPLQDKLTERMMMAALRLSSPEQMVDMECVVDQGKYISLQSIQEYPYIKFLIAKLGDEKLMNMFQAMCGDYSGVAKSYNEDILISGLGDQSCLSKVTNGSGQEIVCASIGSCSSRADKMSMVRVTFPKQGSNGKVEIVEVKSEDKTSSPNQNGVSEKKAEPVEESKADTISVESL